VAAVSSAPDGQRPNGRAAGAVVAVVVVGRLGSGERTAIRATL
jgi:hypothetical protein